MTGTDDGGFPPPPGDAEARAEAEALLRDLAQELARELIVRPAVRQVLLESEAWCSAVEPPPCRICGCTPERACRMPDGGGCWWVAPGLCSACAPAEDGGE